MQLNWKIQASVLLSLCSFSTLGISGTCPVDLYSGREVPDLVGKTTKDIHAYKYDGKLWHKIPLQVVDRHTGILQTGKVSRSSRIILESANFGKIAPRSALGTCGGLSGLSRVELPAESSYAYIGACDLTVDSVIPSAGKYSYNPALRKFETPGIRYEHKKTNEFLFTKSYFKVGDTWELIAENAGFNMYLNPKRFFAINFDDTKVRTKMHDFKGGKNALGASLSFYLKWLFFKLNLRTDSNATFFKIHK